MRQCWLVLPLGFGVFDIVSDAWKGFELESLIQQEESDDYKQDGDYGFHGW